MGSILKLKNRDADLIVRESRGLYRLADVEPGANNDLVQVALGIPKGVICLISALAFHGLTTQIPRQVYVALPNDAEKPRLEYPPLSLFWLSQLAGHSSIQVTSDISCVLSPEELQKAHDKSTWLTPETPQAEDTLSPVCHKQ